MNSASGGKRAVLVGAGHAHLEVVRRAAEFTRRGFELVLVAPEPFWYSGLATGMLGGMYPPSLNQIDVGALISRGGGQFVQDHVDWIDVATRMVHCRSGLALAYDVASFDVGSDVPSQSVPGLAEHGVLVKPISNLWRLRLDVEQRLRAPAGAQPLRILVAGAGATGCELAGNLRRLADQNGGAAEIAVLTAGDRLLESLPRRAADRVEEALRRRGVAVLFRSRVIRVEQRTAFTADGRSIDFDILVGAVGLRPPPLLRSSGLPADDEGAMLVDEHLRSLGDSRVFGGGDCVGLVGYNLAKIGVYAVRQAPILLHNLLATLEGKPLRRFRPQRRYLLILNLGDGTGLATWGPFHWLGLLPLRLKDRIDRRFLKKFRPDRSATAS